MAAKMSSTYNYQMTWAEYGKKAKQRAALMLLSTGSWKEMNARK